MDLTTWNRAYCIRKNSPSSAKPCLTFMLPSAAVHTLVIDDHAVARCPKSTVLSKTVSADSL